MNETQVQAQINALVNQRNAALNDAVNLAGANAVLEAKVEELTKALAATTALIADNATVVEKPNA
jgi:peptidoglycan hydrolase CwlO-like protein